MDKKEVHWEVPRVTENAWLFEPRFDVSEEEKLSREENEQKEDTTRLNDPPKMVHCSTA